MPLMDILMLPIYLNTILEADNQGRTIKACRRCAVFAKGWQKPYALRSLCMGAAASAALLVLGVHRGLDPIRHQPISGRGNIGSTDPAAYWLLK